MKTRTRSLFLLATVVMLCTSLLLPAGAAGAATHPSGLAQIAGVQYADITSLFDFSNSDIGNVVPATNTNGEKFAYEIINGLDGKCMSMKAMVASSYADAVWNFKSAQDWSAGEGILFYVDMTKMNQKPDSGNVLFNFALRTTSTGTTDIVPGKSNDTEEQFKARVAYFLEDGKTTWESYTTEKIGNKYFQFPKTAKGWVYIPFSSYVSKDLLGDSIDGVSGANSVTGIHFQIAHYDVSSAESIGNILIDNISLVKAGTQPSGGGSTTAPQTGDSAIIFTAVASIMAAAMVSFLASRKRKPE